METKTKKFVITLGNIDEDAQYLCKGVWQSGLVQSDIVQNEILSWDGAWISEGDNAPSGYGWIVIAKDKDGDYMALEKQIEGHTWITIEEFKEAKNANDES